MRALHRYIVNQITILDQQQPMPCQLRCQCSSPESQIQQIVRVHKAQLPRKMADYTLSDVKYENQNLTYYCDVEDFGADNNIDLYKNIVVEYMATNKDGQKLFNLLVEANSTLTFVYKARNGETRNCIIGVDELRNSLEAAQNASPTAQNSGKNKLAAIVKVTQQNLPMDYQPGIQLVAVEYDGTYYIQTLEIEAVEGAEEEVYNSISDAVEEQKHSVIDGFNNNPDTELVPALKDANAGMKAIYKIKNYDKSVEW